GRSVGSVQSECGCGAGDQGYRGNGRWWDQIPVDDVAERLVDTYAVDVHRETLRGAEQRRSREAVIGNIELHRAGGAVADIDAAEVVVEVIGEIQRQLATHVRAVTGLYVGRYLIGRQAETGERRVGYHGDLRQLLHGSRIDGSGHGRLRSPRDTRQPSGCDAKPPPQPPICHHPPACVPFTQAR